MRSKVSEKQTVCVSVNGEDLQDVNPIFSTAPSESRGKASQYVGTDARRRCDRDKDLLSHRTNRLCAKLFGLFSLSLSPTPKARGTHKAAGIDVGCTVTIIR